MSLKYLATAACAGSLSVSASEAAAEKGSDWSFDVAPYLWVAGVAVETSLPASSSDDHRFATRITGGAMLAAQLRYKSVGLLMDFAWLQLDTKAIDLSPLYSAVDLKSDFIHNTLAATYSLPLEGKFHVELMAGARLWYVQENLAFQSGILYGFQTSIAKTWVDPLIGANMTYDLSRDWSLVAKGTVGGFGVSADFALKAFCGANYRINDRCRII